MEEVRGTHSVDLWGSFLTFTNLDSPQQASETGRLDDLSP